MATREEEHSTRGRANALRGALSGLMPREELFSPRMHDVLDLCLECKACAAECPTGVDMAKIKYEFLYHYQRENGLPFRSRLFGNVRLLNRIGSKFAPLSNRLAASPVARRVQQRLGIAPERRLPPFAHQDFFTWYAIYCAIAHEAGLLRTAHDFEGHAGRGRRNAQGRGRVAPAFCPARRPDYRAGAELSADVPR
jgi:Fe-S oxidoreductase